MLDISKGLECFESILKVLMLHVVPSCIDVIEEIAFIGLRNLLLILGFYLTLIIWSVVYFIGIRIVLMHIK